jgi:hypothetical protein
MEDNKSEGTSVPIAESFAGFNRDSCSLQVPIALICKIKFRIKLPRSSAIHLGTSSNECWQQFPRALRAD